MIEVIKKSKEGKSLALQAFRMQNFKSTSFKCKRLSLVIEVYAPYMGVS